MQELGELLYGVDFRLVSLLAFVFFAASAELGRRIGMRAEDGNDELRDLMNVVAGALMGILGLLLAFTMSMAVSRWDVRHDLVVDEANAIGALWLGAGFLDPPARDELRSELFTFAKARIDFAAGEGAPERIAAVQAESDRILAEVWSDVESAAATVTNPAVLSYLISAADSVLGLNEERLASYQNHLPPTVMFLLVFLGCIAMGFVGWNFGAAKHRHRSAVLILAFSLVLVLAFLMDLNRPQRGSFVVGVKPYERLLASMVPPD